MASVSDSLAIALVLLNYLVLPFQWLLQLLIRLVLLLVTPVYNLLAFILLPVTHLARVLATVLRLPFRTDVLANVEALYIFISIAVLIGLLSGCLLHVFYNLSTSLLGAHPSQVKSRTNRPSSEQRQKKPSRTAASRRWERQQQKRIQEEQQRIDYEKVWGKYLPESSTSSRTTGLDSTTAGRARKGRGLRTQTILEEEDSF